MDQDNNQNRISDTAHKELPFDSGCDEEISFCNCENSEQNTPYQNDGSEYGKNAPSPLSTAQRLCAVGRKSNGNPYIKTTCDCRADFFKAPHESTPIDSFSVKKVKACSLKTLALIGGAALLMVVAVKCIASSLKD